MDLKIAEQQVFFIKNQISLEDAKALAWKKKLDAFGTLEKFSGLWAKFKEEDFEIIYTENRYQPFWHIASLAHYVYDRNTFYQIEATGKEVGKVTIGNSDYPITNGHLHVPAVEHCVQDVSEELLLDAINGDKSASLKIYLSRSMAAAKGEKINKPESENAVLVPPQIRISGILREMLAKLIQGIQADKIFEEKIEIAKADLYYRPVFAFQFKWKSKNKEAILEVDGVTGAVSNGSRTFKEFIGLALDRDFLFDVGADAVGIFVPGGSIAVKTAKKIMDSSKK